LRRSTRKGFNSQVAVLEGCVGESRSERKEWLRAIVLIAAITNEYSFFIDDAVRARRRIVAVVCRVICPATFEGDRQTPRRVHISKKNFGQRRATFLPRIPRSEEHTSELQSRGHLVCR